MHPQKDWIDLGIRFGPKPRLILFYLNTQAIVRQTPIPSDFATLQQHAVPLDERALATLAHSAMALDT